MLLLQVEGVFHVLDWEVHTLLFPCFVPLLSIESVLEVHDGMLGAGCAPQLGAIRACLDRMEGLEERPHVCAICLVNSLSVLFVRLHAHMALLHP